MALMVDELAVCGDLRLDQAAEIAEVTVIDGTLVPVGDDVFMHRLERRVHVGDEVAAGGAGARILDDAAKIVSGEGVWHRGNILLSTQPECPQ
jgi:hypothetical protein